MKILKGTLILTAMLVAALQQASGMALRLTDPNSATSITVGDGGSGSIFFSGPVGPTWTANVSVGLNLGDPMNPYMDLDTFDNSGGAGTLIVELSETNFLGNGTLTSDIGGTTIGSLVYTNFADAGNTLFGEGTLLVRQGPFVGPAFNGTVYGTISVVGPYSLTLKTVITHAIAGLTSFDSDIVIEGPVITPKPLVCSISPSAAVCAGDSQSFTVSADGGTPPYQTNWTGPNGPLASTDATITINNAQLSDAGTYTATITDSSTPTIKQPPARLL
jgi:hypothetical protein